MTKKTVLCFGDSNTHGTRAVRYALDIRRYPPDVRWPGQMAAQLGDDWHVVEEGHPSRTTVHDDPIEGPHKNGLAVLPALLDSHRPIDLIIIMLGTNDLKMRYSLPAMDIAASLQRLLSCIVTSISGPDLSTPKVLIVAPVPILETGYLAEMFEGGAEKSRKLAKYFAAVAKRNDVGFFDAGSVASVDPVDGIHLIPEGHAAIGQAIAATVIEMMD
jgi:lysophospholipase L1-like esterase